MKKLFFLLFVFYSYNTFAQQWCTPGSRWHHGISFFSTAGYAILTYEKDTVFAGKNCQKIIEYNHTVDQWDWTYNDSYGNLFTYDSGGVVFLYDSWISDWDTIYNFSANPGEKWEMIKCNPGSFTNVIDTGTIIIQGESIKWLYVEYIPAFTGFSYDTIYERIGARKNFPYTSSVMSTDGEYGGTCSFSDTTINQFPNTGNACEYMPDGLSEQTKDKLVIVYPNPTNGTLFLNYVEEMPLAFDVLDICGRQCSGKNVLYNNTISLEELEDGIYFLKFYFKDHTIIKNIEIIK